MIAGRLRTACAAGFLLLLLALPAAVQAQFIYTTNNGTITLRGYTGPGGVVNIPGTIDGLPVTSIGEDAFFGQSSLTGVTIPTGVASIGLWAFGFCDGLTNVTIPNSVTHIEVLAFSACYSLTSVTIPNSVTHIGYEAFSFCSSLTAITVQQPNDSFSSLDGVLFDKSQTTLLRCPGGKIGSYTMPNGVTTIEYNAFTDCNNLTSVTIPNSFTNIADTAFSSCTSLTAITVEALNPSYSSMDGVLFDKSQATLIQYPAGKAGNYTIPDSVTSIGSAAFYSCISPTNVTIPNGVTNIGNSAFGSFTNLTNITIPDGVTSIGNYAFFRCASLTSVTIPNNVTRIGDLAFSDCTSLTAITVDAFNSTYSSVDGVLYDKSQATLIQYPGGKAGNYTIPNGVTVIQDNAFYSCNNLAGVTIPNSVTSIGDFAFSGCPSLTAITVQPLNSSFSSVDGVLFDKSLTTLIQYPAGNAGSYTIPDSVTNIGTAFSGCINLTSVTIPNSVTSIGNSSFYSCTGLTNVTMGKSVTSIDPAAFYQCASLTNVTIPNSVTNMARSAFYFCTNLTGVYFKGNAPSADFSVFPTANNAIVYYLPGTTGWGPTFGGRRAVLWNPELQTSDASFGVQANQFGFTISGTSGLVIVVEACTNLVNPVWSALGTTTLIGGSSYFGDPQWTNHPNRLYRLRSP